MTTREQVTHTARESHSCTRGTPGFNTTGGHRQFPGAGPRTALWPALLGALRGTVLELGPGAGGNLHHYAPGVRWVGVEPSAAAREQTRAEATRLGMHVEVRPGRAEALDLADSSVDAVVCSFVLCSVADQAAALAQVRRVLRPDGRFVFAEHVAAVRGTWTRRAQNVCAAFSWQACRPNRDSGRAIQRAGFTVVDLHRFTMPGPFGLGIPHLAGAAEPNPEGPTR